MATWSNDRSQNSQTEVDTFLLADMINNIQQGICTEEQISQLEEQYGVHLPLEYRRFLKGEHAGVYSKLFGSDFDMKYLPELRQWAKEILEECGKPFELQPNNFVFLMHQGYFFSYFSCTNHNDNPPVYCYLEGKPGPELEAEKFTDWIDMVRNSQVN